MDSIKFLNAMIQFLKGLKESPLIGNWKYINNENTSNSKSDSYKFTHLENDRSIKMVLLPAFKRSGKDSPMIIFLYADSGKHIVDLKFDEPNVFVEKDWINIYDPGTINRGIGRGRIDEKTTEKLLLQQGITKKTVIAKCCVDQPVFGLLIQDLLDWGIKREDARNAHIKILNSGSTTMNTITGYITLEPIYKFISGNNNGTDTLKMIDGDSYEGSKLFKPEIEKITANIPEKNGFYALLNKNLNVIELRKTNKSEFKSLKGKIEQILNKDRSFLWGKYISEAQLKKLYLEIYPKDKSLSSPSFERTERNFERLIKKKNALYFIWHSIENVSDEEMTTIHGYLEKFFTDEKLIKDMDSIPQNVKEIYENMKAIINELEAEDDVVPKTEFNNYPHNLILYGPPGTGKTYNTILKAAQIIENKTITNYSEAQKIFNDNLGDRIEFITFHQNYSYEDFIQGLRPDVDNSDGLFFIKKDGVFKLIAYRALKNLRDSENPQNAKKTFEEIFKEFILPLANGEKTEIEIPMKRVSFFITGTTEKSIEFRKNDGNSEHTLSKESLQTMYNNERNEIISGGLQQYYEPLLKMLLDKGNKHIEEVKRQNYVIIIDEINRANISRVFGELITLIEPDKRSHGDIPLKCKLPSGDEFIVPSNLYIIGTMNTADKSISLLDIALRRRFTFEAMYPLYKIERHIIHHANILFEINKQIIKSKGRDFQIGHSYFMNKGEEQFDLAITMKNKVIPLLLEYFLNDEDEVMKILTGAGLKVKEDSWPIEINL
jgi:5-methylcytosine-specific restriction endonuclease McrBC GTP-binding regulatory subunit McrB